MNIPKILYTISLLLAMFACRDESSEYPRNTDIFENDIVILSGQIDDWNTLNKKNTLSIFSRELLGGNNQYSIQVNESGSFDYSFDTFYPHDLFLMFGNESLRMLVQPGDSIYLTFSATNWNESIKFHGDGAKTNSDLQYFQTAINQLIASERLYFKKRNFLPKDFVDAIFSFSKKCDSAIAALESTKNPSKKLLSWVRTQIRYRCAEELIEYGWRPVAPLPKNYYDNLDQYPLLNDDKGIMSSQYYKKFLPEYLSYQIYVEDKSKKIGAYYDQAEYYSYLKEMSVFLSDKLKDHPLDLDIMLTQKYFDFVDRAPEVVDSLYPLYSSLVENPTIKTKLRQAVDKEINRGAKIKKLMDLANDEIIGDVFREIIARHAGKVLYLDFWGTWCKPCLEEMPYSFVLQQEFNRQDIGFIYLACLSPEEQWREMVDNFDNKGEHFLLSKEQYLALTEKFDISALPRYMIVNRKGEFVDEYASRPSSSKIKNSLQMRM